ncbi:hypothetical protein PoB_007534200 [Plakobranchus ocellatus]|uniref:Uncharacterized protein n=1 Tax=Plakobranchus ocellatus TaxID=259542 RepID=A0AAV4DX14_9GAST|nr:hypothetical protein PoB_007534200 [Plakobranchus ocellatus]
MGVFKTMKCEWKKAIEVKRDGNSDKKDLCYTCKDAYEPTIARPLAQKAFRTQQMLTFPKLFRVLMTVSLLIHNHNLPSNLIHPHPCQHQSLTRHRNH